MSFDNAYRPKAPAQAPDLSRAPQHVRTAMAVTIPYRDGEVAARVMTFRHMTNVPNGRLFVARNIDHEEKRETVVLQCLDYQGINTLAQVELDPASLPNLIQRLHQVFRATGGDPKTLLEEQS